MPPYDVTINASLQGFDHSIISGFAALLPELK